MLKQKSISVPLKLNNYSSCNQTTTSDSFNNFQELKLNGNQKLLSFGEYSCSKNYNRKNRLKIIHYFYKNLGK